MKWLKYAFLIVLLFPWYSGAAVVTKTLPDINSALASGLANSNSAQRVAVLTDFSGGMDSIGCTTERVNQNIAMALANSNSLPRVQSLDFDESALTILFPGSQIFETPSGIDYVLDLSALIGVRSAFVVVEVLWYRSSWSSLEYRTAQLFTLGGVPSEDGLGTVTIASPQRPAQFACFTDEAGKVMLRFDSSIPNHTGCGVRLLFACYEP